MPNGTPLVVVNADGNNKFVETTQVLPLSGQYTLLVGDQQGDATPGTYTVCYAHVPVPLPGYSTPPTDPDFDCIYEDLNGNGRLDFADVVLYFNQMTWIAANEPVCPFDLNHNKRIDFADIVALFNEI